MTSTVAIVAISSSATLAGSAIAGFFGFDAMRRRIAADQQLWIRTSRRETYGRFAGKCSSALASLAALRWGIANRLDDPLVVERWRAATTEVEGVTALIGEVELVANTTTTTAAKLLARYLKQVKDELVGGQLREGEDYWSEFNSHLTEFISAARTELGIA